MDTNKHATPRSQKRCTSEELSLPAVDAAIEERSIGDFDTATVTG